MSLRTHAVVRFPFLLVFAFARLAFIFQRPNEVHEGGGAWSHDRNRPGSGGFVSVVSFFICLLGKMNPSVQTFILDFYCRAQTFSGTNVCFNNCELAKMSENGAHGMCRKVGFEVE